MVESIDYSITLLLFDKAFVEFVHSEVDKYCRKFLAQVFIFIFELSAIVFRIIQLLLVAHLWRVSRICLRTLSSSSRMSKLKVLFSTIKKVKLKVLYMFLLFLTYTINQRRCFILLNYFLID